MSSARKKVRSSPKSGAPPAQIEYRGMRGTTQLCLEALASHLQESREKGLAILLSGPRDKYKCRSHAFLLTVEDSPELLISDGFSSGYMGEGPHGLILAISILETSGWCITDRIFTVHPPHKRRLVVTERFAEHFGAVVINTVESTSFADELLQTPIRLAQERIGIRPESDCDIQNTRIDERQRYVDGHHLPLPSHLTIIQ